MLHIISLSAGLFGLWLLLSGIFKPLIIFFGVVSVLLVVWLARRMDLVDHEAVPVQLTGGILGYWIWLAKEIAVANYAVARVILDPKLPISPVMVRVKATQKTDVGRVIHANSITLTPGTVSVELEGDEILVHALTQELADGTMEGSIDRRVTAVEGRG